MKNSSLTNFPSEMVFTNWWPTTNRPGIRVPHFVAPDINQPSLRPANQNLVREVRNTKIGSSGQNDANYDFFSLLCLIIWLYS
jgi:hypothetical protein